MKKKIYVILTIIISLFMFSSRVEAINITVECEPGTDWFTYNISEYAVFTKEDGSTRMFGLRDDLLYYTAYYIPDYDCWLKNGYGLNSGCADSIRDFDKKPTDIFTKGICPKSLYIKPWSGSILGVGEGDGIIGENSALVGSLFSGTSYDTIADYLFVPSGAGKTKKTVSIDKTEYVVYTFKDGDGNQKILMEGYVGTGNNTGAFAYVGPNIWAFVGNDIIIYQLYSYTDHGPDFWKVHEIDETRMIFSRADINGESWFTKVNVCTNLTAEQCKQQHGYKVLLDSKDSNGNMKKLVSEWFEENKEFINEDTNIFGIIENNNLNDTCKEINSKLAEGKSFSFKSDYNASSLVTDLEKAYNSLSESYKNRFSYKDYTTGKKTEIDDSVVTKAYKDIFQSGTLLGISYGDGEQFHVNHSYLISALQRDLKEQLGKFIYGENENDIPSVNVFNVEDYLNDYTLLYFTTISHLDSNNLLFGLNTEQARTIERLRKNFENLVKIEELDIYPIVDCKGLLGQDLIDKINDYLDIIKIAVPIIVIGFGTFDFTKAIFGGEEDMKKAQQAFLKRIAIALIIFITPTIVNLLLKVANTVWPIISPSSCGIFE